MNKIFKTKYDVTTGQTKVVSELANNRQVASRVEGASVGVGQQPIYAGLFAGFKVLPLALLMSGLLSSVAYGSDNAYIFDDLSNDGNNYGSTVAPYKCVDRNDCWVGSKPARMQKSNESVMLSHLLNKTGANTQFTNKDFAHTVVVGSRAVGGGNDATAIGYRAIVGKNLASTNVNDSHQGTAVGYRAFSYGNESVSLGNDTVAYGESSISIGSDNVGRNLGKYSKTGLSYDIWKLYRQNGSKFNYTGEYAAIDGANSNTDETAYRDYLAQMDPSKPFYKTHNWAYGDSSVAIGSRNVAYGNAALAMGTLSVAKGNYSTALGTGVLAFGDSSVAMGNETYVYSNKSVGIGNEVQAIKEGSIVYGLESYAGGKGSIALGTRALANVQTSPQFKEKTKENVYGEKPIYEQESTYNKLGELDQADPSGYFKPETVTQGGTGENKAIDNGKTGGVAIGYYALAYGENTVSLGRQVYAKGAHSLAMGPYAYSGGDKSSALGYGSKSLGNRSLALGALSRAEGENSIAIGIQSAVKNEPSSNQRNGRNTIALGNETEATMDNSVALGYKSTTKYVYRNDNKNTATLNGDEAIELDPYIPEGSSYTLRTDKTAGIVSVGWKKSDRELGLRRIVGVAPGALDSDVATIGQLRALAYVKKEGVVTYYTKEGNKIIKLTKGDDGKFYKVNTKDGTPYKDLPAVDNANVFVGPKGANETTKEETRNRKKYSLGDMGDKIKFAHILDGEIKDNSDHAITGNQLKNVGDILGISINNSSNTKFDTPSFTKVQYEGSTGNKNHTTFKKAIDELIAAVNKGLVIKGDDKQGTITLGSTLNIKAGNISVTEPQTKTKTEYKSDNIRTAYQPNNKTLLIGIKENPTFKSVTVSDPVEDSSSDETLTTKKYVDTKLQDAGKTHYLSVKGTDNDKGTSSNYNNDGAKANYSVAIGVNAQVADPTNITVPRNKPKPTATAGIAIGHNAKSEAENAVAIGTNASIDVPNSFVMGSNNIVTQENKEVRSAVVVIGSGIKLDESKSSIAIGAVYTEHKGQKDGTVIEQAAWTASIGNKNKIKNGTDIVALGNNIKALDETNETAQNGTKNANTNLILIGNGATAETAQNSVLVGAQSKALKGAKDAVIIGYKAEAKEAATGAVVIGQGAKVQTKATGAIAFGQGATVNTEASNAIAFGQGANVQTKATGAIAFGESASVSVADGIALGSHSVASTAAGTVGFNTVTGQAKAGTVSEGAWKSKYGALSIGGNNNGTRQITGVAAGTNDTDAVNVAQLKEATLHFVSVNGGISSDGNYANNGATQKGAVAIGIGTKAESQGAVSIGYGTQVLSGSNNSIAIGAVNENGSETKIENATWAVAIGNKTGVTAGSDIVALGSNIKVEKSKAENGNNVNDSVIAIGNGVHLKSAKESVGIGKSVVIQSEKALALGRNTKILDNSTESIAIGVADSSTQIENAKWSVAIGNKTSITGGNDIVALGSNIAVTGNDNASVVAIGNGAKAHNAKNSVVIGKGAESKAQSAVVIGDEAKVEAAAGESIALGKGSEATKKETAPSEAISSNSVKFKWTGGVSSDNAEGNKKSVLSIGKANNERIIKHVAAGAVTSTSTDAINGSQLYAVADEFSKLAVNVLGAEVEEANKTGFKKSTFDVAKYQGSTNTPAQKEMTFKAAIAQNTTAINQGFIFGVGDQTNEYGTHYLGDKLIIKAGAVDKPSTTQDGGYVSDNIKTAYLPSKKEIVIGIKDKPTFKNVIIENGIPEDEEELKKGTYDKHAVNKAYLDKRLEKVAANFTVKGDNSSTDSNKVYTLDKDHNELTIAGDSKNIETTVDKDSKKVSINLKDTLTGITSIANNDTKIELNNGTGGNGTTKSIVFTAGDTNNKVTLTGDKFSGVSEIGKDENAKITFNSNGQKEIGFKAGSTTYKFKETGLDLAGKPIKNLGSGLDQKTGNGASGRQDLDELLKLIATNGQPSESANDGKLNKAINAGDLLHVAQGLVNKGLKFKADSASTDSSTTETTKKLGETLTFKGDSKYLTTKLNDTNGEISFNLSVAESISDTSTDGDSTQNTTNSKLVTENAVKNFVTNKINLISTLQLEGDNSNSKDFGKVKLKAEKLKLTGENDFIETEVKANDPTVTIKLAQKVKDKLAIINVGENTNGDNSFALGQNSTLEAKKLAPSGATPNVSSNDVTITWNTAGASKDENDLREVVSVGSAGKERIITHVAAGAVQSGSTDAINGGQLHRVIDVFGKLGLDVLGAEKADTGDGFKKSKFDVVKTSDNATDSNPEKSAKTFKKAIEDNIAAINKGLKFAGDNDGEKQLYLGSTLNIKGAKGEASSASSTPSAGSNSASSDTTNNHQNIFTKASDTGLEIALNEALQGISSISGKKGTDGSAVAKIALDNDKKTITFTAGEKNNNVTLSEGKFSGVSEINKADDKGALKLTENSATLESTKDNSKLELKDKAVTLESVKDGSNVALDGTSATLSAGKDKGSIKVATGSGDGDNKIELSPEKDVTVTLEKDGTNGVKAKGLSTVGLDGDNALVFKNDTSGTDKMAELKVGGKSLTFTKSDSGDTVKISNVAVGNIATDSKDAITGGQLHDLASKLGVEVESETGFKQPSFTAIKGGTSSTGDTGPTTFKGAIDDLITAVNGGLTFKGNDGTPTSTTLQLGGTLTIDSSPVSSTTEKDITVSLTPSTNGDAKDAGTLTLKLNKADKVDENDEKVVTSKAVATKLQEYTRKDTLIEDLEEYYLEIDGANVKDKAIFGENVGIEKINLEEDETEGTSELVQAKALVDYLKGTGDKSVKLSDSAKTQAIGEGSISIGHNAVSRNEGSIAMGYNSEASNSGAISIGQGSTVLGTSSVAVGKENDVKGNFSFVLGEGNTLDKEQTYVIGSDNKISGAKNIAIGLGNTVGGNENIVLGSHVDLKDDVEGAIVLGDKSIGVSNAVSVGNALTKRRIVFVDTPQGEYDAVNKKYVDDLTLTYKSNSNDKTKKSINLKTGALDFKKATNDNIQVVVAENGSIQHNLANNLKDVTSISGGTDESGAKITLESSKKEISLNGSKLKGLADGEIKDDSTDVITGKQLADLTKQLGVDVNTSDKTKFTAPIFEYLSNVDGSFNKNPTTLKEAIDETRAKLNAGLTFGGDLAVPKGQKSGTHYLGSTINIMSLATATGTDTQPKIADYSGSNLITQYSYNDGNANAKIEIGFKNAPTFSKVTLSAPQTYGNGKGVEDNDLITKSYLEEALNSFKFNVANGDGTTYQIGRNDTLKFNAGLNIKVELAKNSTTQPSAVGSALASGASSSNSGDSTAGGGNGTASVGTSGSTGVAAQGAGATGASSTTPTTALTNNGSTGSDSAVTSSTTSSSGAGTTGESGTSSTASSGATPSTTTAGTASSTPSTTSNTTAVVTIGTTEDLTGLKSAEFNGDNGNTTNITGNAITLKDDKGTANMTGSEIALKDKEGNVTIATLNDKGLTIGDNGDTSSNKTHTVYDKDGLAVHGKDGKNAVSLKVADGENGQDGKGATLAFAKGTDGKLGTGEITGLKDLTEEADGSSAVNKNYVDGKVSDLDSNRPFNFYIQEGNDYTKVIKGRDGKFYTPDELKGAKYDGTKYIAQDGTTIDTSLSAEDKVIIRAEPTTAPIGINNVASGLGISELGEAEKKQLTQAVEAKKAEAEKSSTALAQATDTVDDKQKVFTEKNNELAQVAGQRPALLMQKAEIEQQLQGLGADDPRRTAAQEALTEVKKLIAQNDQKAEEVAKAANAAFEDLKNAKLALADSLLKANKAQKALADAEDKESGVDRVKQLLADDPNIKETNVATVKDLKAVAKAGLNFEGNDGKLKRVHKDLSETLAIKGEENASDDKFNSDRTAAGNIKVEMAQDGKGLEVKLSDQLKNMTSFETREINGKKSVLNNGGLTVTGSRDHAGQSASYTLDGVAITGKNGSVQLNTTALSFAVTQDPSGRPVGTGVIRGLKDLDAHATGDMAVNKNYVDARNHELRTQLHSVNRESRSGIAGANAAAALPMITMPGKSALAVSAGAYKGQSAVALGYSRMSDNGKIMLKLHGNSTSTGDFGGGVGIGWAW
ncbi:YadA-like family protein [Histophilus somni]|uniref:YadA-like family protein n=1 Tax=Histophilus somni TaxID=731 RepID=UPI00201EE30C|nr:YadA-like family protein [Histophilus somni]